MPLEPYFLNVYKNKIRKVFSQTKNIGSKVNIHRLSTAFFYSPPCKELIRARSHVILTMTVKVVAQMLQKEIG